MQAIIRPMLIYIPHNTTLKLPLDSSMDFIGSKREAEKVLGARMKGKDITPGGSPSISRHHSPSPSSSEVTQVSTSQSPPAKSVREDQRQSRTEHVEVSIESLLGHLELIEKLPIGMFSAVGAIFKQATRHEGTVDPGGISEWQAVLEGADTLYRHGRIDVAALKLIRSILDYLWLNGPEDDLVEASRALADACRECELYFIVRHFKELLTIQKPDGVSLFVKGEYSTSSWKSLQRKMLVPT